MYDHPGQRDERISKLEQQLADLRKQVDDVAREDASAHAATLKLQLLQDRINDECARKLKEYGAAIDVLGKVLGFLHVKHPGLRDEFVQWCKQRKAKQSASASSQTSGGCDCDICKAERAGDGEAFANAVGGVLTEILNSMPGFKANVEVVEHELMEEFARRAKADGIRAAKEWLGAEQLRRGAEGR